MTEQPIANKERIRNFQQKIMNRSIADLMCFEGLADYLLECCSAEAKANTLSLFSFLPILITSIFISGPSRMWFILSAISLLLHQILDIANKKQAYRLQSFSFGSYYFDHMCDTFSCLLIVYIMGTLFQVSHNWLWLFIFLFAILPFYIHHLTMYYNQYMCFPSISPATEGNLSIQPRSAYPGDRMFYWLYFSYSLLYQDWIFYLVRRSLDIHFLRFALVTGVCNPRYQRHPQGKL